MGLFGSTAAENGFRDGKNDTKSGNLADQLLNGITCVVGSAEYADAYRAGQEAADDDDDD